MKLKKKKLKKSKEYIPIQFKRLYLVYSKIE